MNKLCVLVGGSRGLGKAIRHRYVEAGWKVVEFSRSGGFEHSHAVDLSHRESSIDTIDAVLAQEKSHSWKEVQLIVNAAMLEPVGPLHMSEPKAWWQHIDVNMTLPISIIGRFQTHFKESTARKVIAFVSSGAAVSSKDGWSLYCATKAGVEHFIRTIALDEARLANPAACVNLDPGVMDTEMQAGIRASTESQFSEVERFIDRYEQGRLVAPEVVANNIYDTLATELETGSTLDVAG